MYAIIETGGKQYRVTEGDIISVEKLSVEAGEKVIFDKVLVMGDGSDAKVGTPYVDAAKVFGEVVENGKAKKVIIYKYKAKKDYRKKQGHRQPYTKIEITGIGEDKPKAVKAAPKKEEPVAEAPADEAVKAELKKESATSESKKPSMAMKKDELIAYAEENGIEINKSAKKQDILDAIEAAEK